MRVKSCKFKKNIVAHIFVELSDDVVLLFGCFFSPPQLSVGIVVSVMLKQYMLFVGIWWRLNILLCNLIKCPFHASTLKAFVYIRAEIKAENLE